MQVDSRLETTTLGDILGGLYREKFTGCVTLTDLRFSVHRIHLDQGRPSQVESNLGGPKLGELLLAKRACDFTRRSIDRHVLSPRGQRLGQTLVLLGCVTESELAAALKQQTLERLERLFQLPGASLRVNLGSLRPWGQCGLLPPESFPLGRPRARSRDVGARFDSSKAESNRSQAPRAEPTKAEPSRVRALKLLGVAEREASPLDIRRAFRNLAARLHPDRAPAAEREQRTRRLAELTAAYHLLLQ